MGRRNTIRFTLALASLATGLLWTAPALAQNHRLLGDVAELGAWVETATVPLHDDGLDGDALAGDGIFSAEVAFAAGAGPRTLRWVVLPDGATLTSGARAQADGTAMRIDLPDGLARTIEFRYTPTAPPGFFPASGLADSYTTGVATDPALRRPVVFVAQGAFQTHLGGLPWNPALRATRFRDDGLGRDLLAGDDLATTVVLLPVPLDPNTELGWSVARLGTNAADLGLELGRDGWGFAADGVQPAPLSLLATPWRPMRFEVDLLRGLTRQGVDDAAFVSPLISEIADAASRISFVEVVNPGPATLSLDGLFLSDDPTFGLLPALLPPAADPGDGIVFFPPGALLLPGARAVVRWPGPESFFATHGRFPDYEIEAAVAAVPEMVPAHPNAIGANLQLDPAGEFLVLGRFVPGEPLVEDVDLVTWGTPTTGNALPDRVDQMPTGAPPAYGPESGRVRTEFAPGVALHARKDLFEAGEVRTPCARPCLVDGSSAAVPSGLFDAAAGARHDESSEPLSSTWALARTATPGAANAVERHVIGLVETLAGTPVAMADVEAVSGLMRVAAVSDATGAFRLGPLDAGRWTLQARKASVGVSALMVLQVTGDMTLPDALRLDDTPARHTLRGVIIDGTTGSGLVGATVTATPRGTLGVAGSGGAYGLDLPAGAYTLVASAPGFLAQATAVVIGSETVLNFTLGTGDPALAVSGSVNDPGGTPLVGARLSLERSGTAPFITTSQTDGTFLFPAVLSNTTYALRGSLQGHQPASMTVDVSTSAVTGLRLQLTPRPSTFSISGTVLDARDDAPLADALVLTVQGSSSSTRSDAAGAFTLGGLLDGDPIVAASYPGFTTTQQVVALGGTDQSGITLRLIATPRFDLRVQVRDAGSDTAISGAQVSLLDNGAGASWLRTTDDRGEVSFVDQPEGAYTVSTTEGSHLAAARSLTLDADQQIIVTLEADPDRRLILNGAIALEGEEPGRWGGTQVTLLGPVPGSNALRTDTTEDGRYHFDDLLPGAYTLEAEHTGFLGARLDLDLGASQAQDLILGRSQGATSPPPGCACDADTSRPTASRLSWIFVGLCFALLGRRRRASA